MLPLAFALEYAGLDRPASQTAALLMSQHNILTLPDLVSADSSVLSECGLGLLAHARLLEELRLESSPPHPLPLVETLQGHDMDVESATACAEALASQGFTTLKSLSQLDEGDLEACHVSKRMHIKTLLELAKSHVQSSQPLPLAPVASTPDWYEARQLRAPFSKHIRQVMCVAASSDGSTMASGSYDDIIILWNSNTLDELGKLYGHTSAVLGLAFNSTGARLASVSKDKTVKLWNVRDLALERTLFAHTERVWAVTFTPDDKTVISGAEDRLIALWDADEGTSTRKIPMAHDAGVRGLAVSALMFASASFDKTIKLWSLAGDPIKQLTGHSKGVQSVAFSKDGLWLVSGSNDETVRVWDVASGIAVRVLTGHNREVNSVAVLGNSVIASASLDKSVRVWDLESGRLFKALRSHRDAVKAVAFTRDGTLVSASEDSTCILWR